MYIHSAMKKLNKDEITEDDIKDAQTEKKERREEAERKKQEELDKAAAGENPEGEQEEAE